MSTLSLSQLEKYILAENKAEALAQITPYTVGYYFLELMNEFQSPTKSETEINALVENFMKHSHLEYDKTQIIKLRHIVSNIIASKEDPEKLKKWLDKLNKEFFCLTFDYPSYTKGNLFDNISKENNQSASTRLTPEDHKHFELNAFLESLYELKGEILNELDVEFYNQIDLNRFSLKNDSPLIEKILQKIENINEVPNICHLLIQHKEIYPNKTFISDHLWNKLTMSNKEILLQKEEFKLNPNLLISYLYEKFEVDQALENTDKSHKERLEGWKKILDYFKGLPNKYLKYQSYFLSKILDINSYLNNYDEDMFFEYLKVSSVNGNRNIYCKNVKQKKEQKHNYAEIIHFFRFVDEPKLINDYFSKLLPYTTKFNSYLEYFDEKMLRQLTCVAKMMNGLPTNEVESILTSDELQKVHNEKMLELSKNKDRFSAGEKVSLKLNIKNIAQLNVRVFEINTHNFLIEKMNDNYETIDATGLIPFEHYVYNYTQSSIIVHQEQFEFPSITERERGVFIVDFIGGELNSRAIIRKGLLTIVNDSQTGRNCVIVDQNGKVCLGQNTGFYIGNLFLASNPATGVISVPLNIANISQEVIAVHEGFAYFSSMNIKNPQPDLNINVLYNGESFVSGNQVELIIQSKLMMNQQKVSVSKLLNAYVIVTSITTEGLTNQNIFKDLKLRDTEDLVVNFIYPSKVKTLKIELNGEVKIGTESTSIKADQTLEIEDNNNSVIERGYFSKNDKNELYLEILGRNGEPISSCNVQLNVKLKFTSKPVQFNKVTDSSGKVHIGNIEHLKDLTANGSFGSLSYFETQKASTIYPQTLQFVENEIIEVPIHDEKAKISLYHYGANGGLKADLSADLVKINKNKLKISPLKQGDYTLLIGQHKIKITIHEGRYMSLNGENIKTPYGLIPLPKTSQFLISHTERNDQKELIVKSEGDSQNLRAHLLVYNYIPQELYLKKRETEIYNNSNASKGNQSLFAFEEKSNSYQSAKRLNDEIIYVYDRKNKASFMGNTLEKPGLLVKRNKLQQTTETAQQINQGTGFAMNENSPLKGGVFKKCCARARAPLGQKAVHNYSSKIRTTPFLASPGKIISNLPISNNIVNLPQDVLNSYSYSILVLTDGTLTDVFELMNQEKNVLLNDCRLVNSKKAGYVIQYERNLSGITKDTSVEIRNIKNTEISVIDSVANLFETLQLLMEGDDSALKEWEFFKNWHNLEPMEKLKKYDKYASHEFNLFLCVKDKEFFDNVVLLLLENKKEKSFIDWYLLNDTQQMQWYFDISSLSTMNKLEIVLLAHAAATLNPGFASSVMKYLKNASVLQIVSDKKKAVIFDTLLSSRGEKVKFDDQSGISEDHNSLNNYKQMELRAQKISSPRSKGARMMDRVARNISESDSYSGSIRAEKRKKEKRQKRNISSDEEEDDEEYEASNCNLELEKDEFVEQADIFMPSQGTVEYNERQYWKNDLDSNIQAFWNELAEHLVANNSSKNFLSQHFIYCVGSFSDCLAMLTFIDLPFEKVKFNSHIQGNDLIINAPTNLLLLSKEVIEKEGEKLDVNVLCAQRFFDPNDRFVYDSEDPTLRVDKKVDEFVVNKIYGCQIVVTNCTSAEINLSIVHEVPQGAIPVDSSDFLKVRNELFESLQSKIFEFNFYFPAEGQFGLYPATVIKGSRIIASAQTEKCLSVKAQKTIKNLETINDILSMGNTDDILDFMNTKNILNSKIFDFSSVYGLLKNRDFYDRLITMLRSKGIFDKTVWSFSLFHCDLQSLQEYLKQACHDGIFSFAKYIKNDLMKLDNFEIREYYPLINKRAHSLGSEKVNIINDAFKVTYTNFLNYLVEKGSPSAEDWLLLTDYLLAQDRFEEAIAVFDRIDSEAHSNMSTKIQRDYLRAYIDFISGYPNFTIAKQICEEYLVYPVLSWRNLFIEMANQLAEFEESALIESTLENEAVKNKNTEKALRAPNFTVELENSQLKIISQNVSNLKIEYFKVDIEVLFSLNPFTLNQGKSYGYVKPFAQETLTLNSGEDYLVYLHALPSELKSENLFIQVSLNEKGISKSEFLNFVPFSLHHHLNQEFGIIKVIDPTSKKPVPKLYVKCFVKYKNGSTAFYKDGYTDLRGSFDYVSLNKDDVNDVDKFSLIIVAGVNGFKMLEAQPPKKIGRVEGEAKQLVSNHWNQLQQKNVGRPQISKYAKLIK